MSQTQMLNLAGTVAVGSYPANGANIMHKGKCGFAGVFAGTGTWSVTVSFAPMIEGNLIQPERTLVFTNAQTSNGESIDTAFHDFVAKVSAVTGTVTSGKFYGEGA